jgi:hypothetical protein
LGNLRTQAQLRIFEGECHPDRVGTVVKYFWGLPPEVLPSNAAGFLKTVSSEVGPVVVKAGIFFA